MPRDKQWVFSARTTEEGLRALNAKKAELGVNWDGLIINAVNAHYGLDVPKLPKAERPPKAEKPAKAVKPKAEKKAKKTGKGKPVAKMLVSPPPDKAAKELGTEKKPKAAKAEKAEGEVRVYNSEGKLVRTEDSKGETISLVEAKS